MWEHPDSSAPLRVGIGNLPWDFNTGKLLFKKGRKRKKIITQTLGGWGEPQCSRAFFAPCRRDFWIAWGEKANYWWVWLCWESTFPQDDFVADGSEVQTAVVRFKRKCTRVFPISSAECTQNAQYWVMLGQWQNNVKIDRMTYIW